MARNRTAFTDEQRAEIYRLDRATCSFSGRNLWILDYGMDPSYAIDWADHINPASKGGHSIVTNGAATSWHLNWMRRDSHRPQYIFRRGRPTRDFLWYDGTIPDSTFSNLKRFADLRQSDWFLNRGLWQVWLSCHVEHEVRCGYHRTRRKEYFIAAAVKSLFKWRRAVDQEGGKSFDQRGLLPKSLEPDQEQLFSASTLSTERELLKLTRGLLAAYRHTATLLSMLYIAETPHDIEKARRYELKYKDIPRRISDRAIKMMDQLVALESGTENI